MHDGLLLLWFVFFFKQKTAYEIRISDWSSDVCFSDLLEQSMQGAQVDPEQMQKMQEELQKLQMENATLKLENKSKEDKHEVDIYNAETQRIRAFSDQDRKSTRLNSSH